jgi:hypothetical protein
MGAAPGGRPKRGFLGTGNHSARRAVAIGAENAELNLAVRGHVQADLRRAVRKFFTS